MHAPRLALATLAAVALTVSGAALAQAPAAAPTDPPDVVWRLSADGDWLAAVARADDTSGPELLLAPLYPQPGVAAAPRVGGVLAIDLGGPRVAVGGERRWLGARSSVDTAPAWCSGLSPWFGTAGMPNDCLALRPNEPQPRLVRDLAALGVAGLATGSLDLGLTYSTVAPTATGLDTPWSGWSTATVLAPWAYDPGLAADAALLWTGPGPGEDLTFDGTWHLSGTASLNLSAGVGQWWSLPAPGVLPVRYEQAALRLGMSYGPFSGGLVGRVVQPAAGTDNRFSGLDLAVSWRTPWEGEISFGARNLLSRGNDALLPDPGSAALDDATSRTPYVHYRQDF